MSIFTIDNAVKATGLTVEEITGPSRVRHLCWTRFAVMEQMRAKGLSLPSIGRVLHRDHTTVLAGLRQVEALRGNPRFESIRSSIA